MSIKIFCDVCEAPLIGSTDRMRRILGNVMIEIIVRQANIWDGGNVCDNCVLKTVNEGLPAYKDESWIADTTDRIVRGVET